MSLSISPASIIRTVLGASLNATESVSGDTVTHSVGHAIETAFTMADKGVFVEARPKDNKDPVAYRVFKEGKMVLGIVVKTTSTKGLKVTAWNGTPPGGVEKLDDEKIIYLIINSKTKDFEIFLEDQIALDKDLIKMVDEAMDSINKLLSEKVSKKLKEQKFNLSVAKRYNSTKDYSTMDRDSIKKEVDLELQTIFS